MIDYIMGIFLILFGLGFGILLGWVLSLPKDDKTDKSNYTETNSAYFDMDDWNECMKDCLAYGYDAPKKKKEKGKSRKQSRKQ